MQQFALLATALGPLFLAALLTIIHPLPLKAFQGAYLLLGGLWIGLHLLVMPKVSVLTLIIILLVGELVHLLTVGLAGRHAGPANNASVLLSVGLFPWYLGYNIGVFYLLLALLFAALYSGFAYSRACRAHGLKGMMKTEYVKKRLSEEEWSDFKRRASIILAAPFALAALLVTSIAFLG